MARKKYPDVATSAIETPVPVVAAQDLQLWPIERLLPYASNPRNNDHAVDQMIAAIREFSFKIPLLARSNGELVDGHLRLKAARKMGLTQVPVILCDEWSPAQVKAFRLLVNRSVTWADWDETLLALEFQDLAALDYPLDLTGFAPSEVASCLSQMRTGTDEDAVPDAPPLPVTQSGDLWIMGRHRLVCADATEAEPVERLMSGEKADLVFLDPPYNINVNGVGSVAESWRDRRAGKSQRAKRPLRAILNDHMSDEKFLEFCRALFSNVRRAVKAGAAAYICCSDKAMRQFRQAFEEAGFHWSCTLIWSKNQFTLSRADYQLQHENLIYGWAQGGTHYWCGKRNQGTIWNIPKPRVNDLHPTQKPVELIERAVQNSSHAGDLVIDFCGGSGSTLIACDKSGRQCRLIEMDPQYADVIVERWQQFSGQTAVLEQDGRSFADVSFERHKVAA